MNQYISAFFIRFIRLFINRRKKSSLIVPASWEGSLGDEAVLEGIASLLKNEKHHYVGVLNWDKKSKWKNKYWFRKN